MPVNGSAGSTAQANPFKSNPQLVGNQISCRQLLPYRELLSNQSDFPPAFARREILQSSLEATFGLSQVI